MNISISLDIDWAHDKVIEDSLSLLSEYGCLATLFATHVTEVLDDAAKQGHEIGIHPNFNFLLNGEGGSIQSIMDGMMALFPNAVGLRSHSLTQSSAILDYARQCGIRYDSNIYHPQQPPPFLDFSGLVRLSMCWVDLGLLLDGDEFALESIPLRPDSDNILDFHPIHIFLNTCSVEMYNEAKQYHSDFDALSQCRNTTRTGIRDLFIAVLQKVNQPDCRPLLREVADSFKSRD